MKLLHKNWLSVVLLVVGLGMLGGTGCKKKPVDPFPASDAVSGWQKTSETRTFKAEDLWQYIDGDSERYTKAGVVSTSTSDYKFNGKLEATVDVYTMSAPEGTKTVFDADPVADGKTVAVGDSARLYAQSLIFRKGRYLVRIVAFTSAPELGDALLALGHGVEAKL